MVKMVLATDMAQHFKDTDNLKNRIKADDWDPTDKDKLLVMTYGCHVSDISNLSKDWDLGLQWTNLLFEEFFAQGDLEKELGLPVGFMMDRDVINIAKQ